MLLGICACSVQAGSFKIVCLGDSITEGYGLEKEQAYPELLQRKLRAAGIDATVTNAGISGSTSASAPARTKWVLKSKPDWIILALGANDGLRGLPTGAMEKSLAEAIRLARAGGAKVLFSGMKVPPNFGAAYSKKFEAIFAKVAKAEKPEIFDPFLLSGVGGEKGYNQADGIHPNAEGQAILAERFFGLLKGKLK